MPSHASPNPLRWMALLPLAEAALPDPRRAAQWYSANYPDEAPVELGSSSDGLQTFTVAGRALAATLIPHPIPWDQLEGPCATAWS